MNVFFLPFYIRKVLCKARGHIFTTEATDDTKLRKSGISACLVFIFHFSVFK